MPLKIILLLDSYTLQAWQFELVKSLKERNNAHIVACVINQTPKPGGTKSPLVYRAYRWLDRKLFLNQLDAFAQKNLREIPNWNVPTLEVSPIQKKYSDYFKEDDLVHIKAFQPDVIIRLGFRILEGEILSLPRLGVWSFHHGDPEVYRGGPPGFWEVMKQIPVTGTVLMRINEKLDEGEVLYASYSQTDPLSVQRNANRIFWKSAFFVSRVISEINRLGEENWEKGIKIQNENRGRKAPLWRPPGNLEMLRIFSSLFTRTFFRKIAEYRKKPNWELATTPFDSLAEIQENGISEINFLKVANPGRGYLADPFPVNYQGNEYVFVEEFNHKKQKGRIACLNPETGKLSTVLETPFHLSYPFVFEENGVWYMVPETGDLGKLLLYRADQFPDKWELLSEFFPKGGFDPTIWKSGEIYWLFVNEKPHPECSSFDELCLYWSESLTSPNWHPHPKNPIVSDVRSSRSAGRLFEEDGKLYRPAQNSGLRYGHQVKIQEITILSKTDYSEHTTYTLSPDLVSGGMGVHTFNRMGPNLYLDFHFRR